MKRGLRIKVEFRGPPGIHAVLKLGPVGVEIPSGALHAKRGKIFNLQVSRLLKIVVVCDKVWIVLSGPGPGKGQRSQQQCQHQGQTNVDQANLLANELQQINKTNLVLYQLQDVCR